MPEDDYPGRWRALAVCIAAGLAMTPLWLELGRRLVFLVLPFALLALVFAPRLLPADPSREQRDTGVSLDPVGAGLLGLSVIAILLPLVLADRDPSGAPWWTIAIGAALLAGFVWWERRYSARGVVAALRRRVGDRRGDRRPDRVPLRAAAGRGRDRGDGRRDRRGVPDRAGRERTDGRAPDRGAAVRVRHRQRHGHHPRTGL